jgi:hypothetical protein
VPLFSSTAAWVTRFSVQKRKIRENKHSKISLTSLTDCSLLTMPQDLNRISLGQQCQKILQRTGRSTKRDPHHGGVLANSAATELVIRYPCGDLLNNIKAAKQSSCGLDPMADPSYLLAGVWSIASSIATPGAGQWPNDLVAMLRTK